VATWCGVAEVSYIVDVFSRIIVGWRLAVHRRTDIVLAAVEMARWSRVELDARSDADSRSASRRSGERLAEAHGSRPPDLRRRRDPTVEKSPSYKISWASQSITFD
jgi:transposase InsO family protein